MQGVCNDLSQEMHSKRSFEYLLHEVGSLLGPAYMKKAGPAKQAGPLNRADFISRLYGKRAGFQPGC